MSLSELTSPAAVKAALREYDRLGREELLRVYGFAPATAYMLLSEGKQYDSKAIAGIAHKYQFPGQGPLKPKDFSGGIAEGAAARKLSSLGFEITELKPIKDDWTLHQCLETVEKYFHTLKKHLLGEEINKAAIYRELSNTIGRPIKAVEYKFQNIDAILSEEDLPRLGRSMASNYQQLLRSVVIDYIRRNAEVFDIVPEQPPSPKTFADVLVDPPTSRPAARRGKARIFKPSILCLKYEENKKLGRSGEEWVLAIEKRKLIDAGRIDLAQKIVWTAAELGDGYGYDILSFSPEGEELLIEVKTTNSGICSSFFISANELAVAAKRKNQFCLYRVFNFSVDPKLFVLTGPLEHVLSLAPIVFQAQVG